MYKEPFDKKFRGDRLGDTEPPRKHPHRGQDWHPRAKTIVPAITDGKITQIFWSDVLGWVVEQKTEDGLFVQYCHLLAKPKKLQEGDAVKLGQPVGRVGSTGSASTGPHLHLSIAKVKNGHLAPFSQLIDPLKHIQENRA